MDAIHISKHLTMPRVTSLEHYRRYQFLHTAWSGFSILYTLFPIEQQWQIHDFYQPSKDLTQDELLIHITRLKETRPALVNQVGKHVRLMMKVFHNVSKDLNVSEADQTMALSAVIRQVAPAPISSVTASSSKDRGRLSVRAVARPEIDMKKLTRAFVMLAEEMIEKEHRGKTDKAP
jgi:hypothetical protein